MRSTITAIQMAIRAVWVVQLVLGLAFWTGNLLGLVDLHQPRDPARARALDPGGPGGPGRRAGRDGGRGRGARAARGDRRAQRAGLLPGSAHWVIQVVHLLLGIGLIGLAENLAVQAKARLAPVA